MTIYIDSDYKCHAADSGGLRPVETDFFEGKCPGFIEGYRFIPAGESWTSPGGTTFWGPAASPWKNYQLLAAIQQGYEESMAAAAAAYAEGVNSI